MRAGLLVALAALVAALPAAAGHNDARVALMTDPSQSEILLFDPHGNLVANLTPRPPGAPFHDERDPTWSPDGTRIAFTSHRDAFNAQEIYVMNADGSEPRRLTFDSGNGQTWNTDPEWSPDGAQIAFRKARSNNADEIWVMSSDGGGHRQVAAGDGNKGRLQWSPDSSRLLFERTSGASGIFAVDVATAEVRSLTPAGAFDIWASWSPDGSLIAFLAGSRTLSLMNPDGTGRRRLTERPAAGAPAWSPDGAWIAFGGARVFPEHGNRFGPAVLLDVYVIRSDGSGERRLTGALGEEFAAVPGGTAPTWWPDGSRLFFSTPRGPSASGQVYVMNADGTCERAFAESRPGLFRPRWRPRVQPALPPTRCADLRVRVEASTDAAALRQPVDFRVVIENDGNETATALRLEGEISPGAQVEAVDVRGSCETGGRLVCRLDALAPGARAVTVVRAASARAGSLALRADVTAAQHDGDTASNRATAATTVLPCTLVGTPVNDALNGTPRADRICGRTGWDRINGLAGNDWIDAGNGNDTVDGGRGRDTVLAQGGLDVVLARDGERDVIACGVQRDVVVADRRDRVARDCEIVHRR